MKDFHTAFALALTAMLAGCNSGGQQSGASSSSSAERAPAQMAMQNPFDTGVDAPPKPDTMFRLAKILAAQGRDDECRHLLTDIIQRHPDFAPAYCDLAELHLRAGRTDDAAEVLEEGIRQVPKDGRLAGNLGMCYMIKGDYERAMENFRKAAALDGNDARHRANLASCLALLGRYDESLAEYQKVLPPAEAHHNVGVLAESRKDLERAKHEFAIASELETTQSPARSTR